ncbi:MAG: alpha/beta fold hydrolase [Burkholderiaceae bacterium]|nr:alpha/beta fold hydrolase [Burkholderiaceae bacterium]
MKLTLLLSAGIPLALLAAALAFGGPAAPPLMESISAPFRGLDMRDLPSLQTVPARDGTALAYRRYAPVDGTPRGSVTLVHGSSASSESLHPLARALSAAGWAVLVPDWRGHGATGARGRIDHVGQLDEDLDDLLTALKPPAPATLLGFSSGGGFALRIAGGPLQGRFQSYLLLSPFLGQDASTHRPDSGGWVRVGVPRLVGLMLLDRLGLWRWLPRALTDLPVTRFALDPAAQARLTPAYGYALATNFRPPADHLGTMRAAKRPVAILVGAQDEAFRAERYADEVARAGQRWPVRVLPGLGHIPMTLDAGAHAAIVETLATLQAGG